MASRQMAFNLDPDRPGLQTRNVAAGGEDRR
jgi:hypothetical protein